MNDKHLDSYYALEETVLKLRKINEQLREACKATKLAIFEEPPERSARWGNVARIIEAAIAAAEAKE